MPTPTMLAGRWPTKVKVQCRSEAAFEATIKFLSAPQKGLVPSINCPWCGRRYFLQDSGEWISDRPLVILE